MQHCRAGCAAAAGPSSSPICLRLRHYKHIHTNTTWHLELTTSTERLQNGFCPTASRRYADPAPPPSLERIPGPRPHSTTSTWLAHSNVLFTYANWLKCNSSALCIASRLRPSASNWKCENVEMWQGPPSPAPLVKPRPTSKNHQKDSTQIPRASLFRGRVEIEPHLEWLEWEFRVRRLKLFERFGAFVQR